MTKTELDAAIAKVNSNQFLPQAVKDLKIKKLKAEFDEHEFGKEFMESKDKGAKKQYAEKKTYSITNEIYPPKYSVVEIISDPFDATKDGYTHMKAFSSKKEAEKYIEKHVKGVYFPAWWKNHYPAEIAGKPAPKISKKTGKPIKKKIPAAKFKAGDKDLSSASKEDCEELLRQHRERRAKAAKSEKKSKTKPVIEKVAANVATAVKQAVDNVSAADIKANPKGEISKMERIAKAAKTFLAEMRSILGDDYDKDSIDDEFKDLHALIKDLKKKYQ